jgi:molecular chaperone HtpG
MKTHIETFEFQAEARQLLQLVIHSIYSDKDIFLRELISNASDAIDRLRMEMYRDKDLQADTSDLHIDIDIDQDNRTLTVRDNGIGMSCDEVIEVIGTIATSGSTQFLRQLQDTCDARGAGLIGEFGIGFYSSFMVADKITLLSRRAGATEATRWEWNGGSTYTIESVDDSPQGTSVTVYLKYPDAENHLFDYAAPWKVREIVKRYSDFIAWPIRMAAEPAGAEADGPEEDTQPEVETINTMKALWATAPSETSSEEYDEFYRHITHDWNAPLETVQVSAEGTFEYKSLLFIPARAPYDLFMPEYRSGIQLYVKRVFIMHDCDALMPDYLRFVKGVVDAQDLALNVSREILQQDRQIQLIRRRLVKKILSSVKRMMTEKPENYATFWAQFGRVVKEGLMNEDDNRGQILDICSFASTHNADTPTTLREYVDRMQDGQEHIYYVTGESRSILEGSPHMEVLTAQGVEVILLTDPIDDLWVGAVDSYDGVPFQSIATDQVTEDADDDEHGDMSKDDADGSEQTTTDEDDPQFDKFLQWMTSALRDDVKQVRMSKRLIASPACIVGDALDISPALERRYRASGHDMPWIKRILELNPNHPLIVEITRMHRASADSDDDVEMVRTAELIYGMAVIAEGGELANPSGFVRTVADRLVHNLMPTVPIAAAT